MWKERKKKERKNNAKFSGHYVRPRTHNVRAHTLRSHQFLIIVSIWCVLGGILEYCSIIAIILNKSINVVILFKKTITACNIQQKDTF